MINGPTSNFQLFPIPIPINKKEWKKLIGNNYITIVDNEVIHGALRTNEYGYTAFFEYRNRQWIDTRYIDRLWKMETELTLEPISIGSYVRILPPDSPDEKLGNVCIISSDSSDENIGYVIKHKLNYYTVGLISRDNTTTVYTTNKILIPRRQLVQVFNYKIYHESNYLGSAYATSPEEAKKVFMQKILELESERELALSAKDWQIKINAASVL